MTYLRRHMSITAKFFDIANSVLFSSKATSGSAFVSASIEERYKQRADMSTNNLRRQKVSTWIS
jgi:CO dehydrogenase/acetyl-CoA synthase epsilon subunit